mgnify:CR=1 FL=1
MKNSNAWTFGIIFIGIFIFLALNKFELPKIFLGETEIVKGTIIETQFTNGIRGIGYYQEIKFIYSINGDWYENTFAVDNKFKPQRIGNTIFLKVSVSHPDKFKVTGFVTTFNKEKVESFIHSENEGYSEIKFVNNILFKTNFGLKGKVIKQEIGKFENSIDTLKFFPIKIIDSLQNVEYVPDSFNDKELFIYKGKKTLVSLSDTLIIFKNT